MQTPPHTYQQQQLPPPPAPPPDERARRIAARVSRKLVSRLAPLVDRFAEGSDAGPILRPPAAPGWVPLRLDTRKALAFDGAATAPFFWALMATIIVGFNAVSCLVGLKGGRGREYALLGPTPVGLVAGVVLSLVTIGIVIACARRVPARIRALRAALARSVVVPARISFATPHIGLKGGRHGTDVAVDYEYAGVWHRTVVCVNGGDAEYALLGPTPELLFDPTRPEQVLFKDLYV